MFHAVMLGLTLFAPGLQPPKPVSDTLLIQFNNQSHTIESASAEKVYYNSDIILRATSIEILIPDYLPARDLPTETLERLQEIKDLLESEGAPMDEVQERRISDRAEMDRLGINPKTYGLKIFHWNDAFQRPSAESPLCSLDTTIFQSDGIGIHIRMCDYLELDALPRIIPAAGMAVKSPITSHEDIRLLHDFILHDSLKKKLIVALPMNGKVRTADLKLEYYNETEQLWLMVNTETIETRKQDKLQYAYVPLQAPGRYRLTAPVPANAPYTLLLAPKGYGILAAHISHAGVDGFEAEKVLGSTALAFQLQEEPSNYRIRMRLCDAGGKQTDELEIPLEACLKKQVSAKSWADNRIVRASCKGRVPEKTGQIPNIELPNQIVSR